MLSHIRSCLQARGKEDLAEVTVTTRIILIAGFVIVTVVVVMWLDTATLNRAADTTACVESNANSYKGPATHEEACGDKAVKDHSYSKDSSYTNRY